MRKVIVRIPMVIKLSAQVLGSLALIGLKIPLIMPGAVNIPGRVPNQKKNIDDKESMGLWRAVDPTTMPKIRPHGKKMDNSPMKKDLEKLRFF